MDGVAGVGADASETAAAAAEGNGDDAVVQISGENGQDAAVSHAPDDHPAVGAALSGGTDRG